jgi:Holliday junction resolvase
MTPSGAKAERYLIRALDACGWTCMRAPASGSGTKRSLPDVLASDIDVRPRAIELKSTKAQTAYVKESEDLALQEFCNGFGAVPILAFYFKSAGTRRKIWLCHPDDCRITDSGSRALSEQNAAQVAHAVVLPETTTKDPKVRDL